MKKTLILPVAIGVAILGCVLAVSANINSVEMKGNLEKERFGRLDAERRLQEAMQKNVAITSDLETAKKKIRGIEDILSQGQTTTSSLKSQMESVVRENEALKSAVEKLKDDAAKLREFEAAKPEIPQIPAPTTGGKL